MKKNKDWKSKIVEWFKDIEWPIVGGIFAVILVLAIPLIAKIVEKDKPKEEQIRTEEFSYKGHKYIKFKGHDLLGTGSVVHDPDCDCRLKTDSI